MEAEGGSDWSDGPTLACAELAVCTSCGLLPSAPPWKSHVIWFTSGVAARVTRPPYFGVPSVCSAQTLRLVSARCEKR